MLPKCSTKVRTELGVWFGFASEWWEYYIVFPKAVPFIFGLILVHAWVEYALVAILITHLMDGMVHLPKAASIVNVQDGTTFLLVLFVAYASDAYLGPFMVLVSTTAAYISGLWLMYVAASWGQSIQTKLLYLAVVFVALGRAGRIVQLKEFLDDQIRAEGSSLDEEQVESRRRVWWRSAYILGITASIFFINASWIQLCLLSVLALGSAFGVFFLGYTFYERKKPVERRLNKMLQVLYAALLKRYLSHTSSDTLMLRWLDKAAIVEPAPSPEEQLTKGRLCTIEQVEEVKLLLSMLPLWATFLVYGLLLATGNTFFYEQSSYTDNKLGSISHVPVVIFVIIASATRIIVEWVCDILFPLYWDKKTPWQIMLVRIGIGMAMSVLCCSVAYSVEAHRMQAEFAISFAWLIPQFLVLGVMEGLVFDGMGEIYSRIVPESLHKYGQSFNEFALNIGQFISLIFISVNRNLFSDDLNESRLAEYYRRLGYVCFGNLLVYCYVATYYWKQGSSGTQDVEQLQVMDEQLQSMENDPGLEKYNVYNVIDL